MGGDIGRVELDYSKRKAEDDLEQLEQSYRVLTNIEQDTEATAEVRDSAAECKTKLEEAMNKLRAFLREVEKALEYENKQEFLINVSLSAYVLNPMIIPAVARPLHNSSFLSPTPEPPRWYAGPLKNAAKKKTQKDQIDFRFTQPIYLLLLFFAHACSIFFLSSRNGQL